MRDGTKLSDVRDLNTSPETAEESSTAVDSMMPTLEFVVKPPLIWDEQPRSNARSRSPFPAHPRSLTEDLVSSADVRGTLGSRFGISDPRAKAKAVLSNAPVRELWIPVPGDLLRNEIATS